jgi:hypothetical protein
MGHLLLVTIYGFKDVVWKKNKTVSVLFGALFKLFGLLLTLPKAAPLMLLY